MRVPFWVVAIIALLGWLFYFFDGCRKGIESGRPDPVKTEVHHHWDTTIHLVHTHKIHYKPAPVDTSELTGLLPEDHIPGQPVVFSDTISDTNISGTYSGIIWENRLFNPQFKYKLLKPHTTVNSFKKPDPRNKLSLGLFTGYSDKPFIGGMAMYSDKRDRLIYAGYGYPETVLFGAAWTVRLRRK